MLAFACRRCRRQLQVRPDLAGRDIRCPACGAVNAVLTPDSMTPTLPADLPTEEAVTLPHHPPAPPAPPQEEPRNAAADETPDAQLSGQWRQGRRLDVAEFLAGFADLNASEVVAVLLVDQRERWQRGERIPAESYLHRFPALAGDTEAVVELAYGEFLLREEHGERPALEEYQRRFPNHAERLRQQVALHRALQSPTPAEAPSVAVAGQTTGTEVPIEGPGVPVVPGYEVLDEVGRGGMGVVYKARQVALNRVVALKMILAGGHAGAAERQRFLAEAEAVAAIKHPGIVQVHDFGTHAGLPYFALEFCPGGSLEKKLAGTPLPPREAAGLVEQVARAVQAAHEAGIVHRDLKPANVLLTFSGGSENRAGTAPGRFCEPPLNEAVPKVTDFGLARRLERGSGLTQTGAVLGTPSYMAPEQAEGKKDIGPAADVWALGAILYECLTGRPPFRAATTFDTLTQVVSAEPVPPRQLQAKVPRDLETVCLKCLHKDPARRYASAADLADDLHRFLQGQAIAARAVGPAERAWRWCRRNPAVAAMTALAALLLVVIAVGASVLSVRLSAALGQSEHERQQAERQRDLTARAERRRRRELFSALLAQAQANRLSRQVGQRFKSIEAIRQALALARELELPAAETDRLRDEAVAALALADLRPAEWVKQPAGDRWMRFCFDIDGASRNYAVASTHGDLFVGRAASNPDRLDWTARLPAAGRMAYHWWSPDGRYLARKAARMEVWRFGTGAPRQVIEDAPAASYGFSADSRLFYAIGTDTLRLFALPAGRLIRTIKVPAGISSSSVRPGHEQIAVGTPQGIHLLDLADGSKRLTWPPVDHAGWIDWTPDGEQLAVAGLDRIHLYSVADPSRRWALEHLGHGLSLGFNADGSLLASVGWDGRLRVWDPVSARLVLSTATRPGNWIRFGGRNRLSIPFPEGGRPDAWRLTEVVPSPVYRTLIAGAPLGGVRQYQSLSVHPAGRLLAVSSRQGLGLLDLQTGRELRFFNLGGTGDVLLSPSGQFSAYNAADRAVRHWAFDPDPDRPGGLRLRTWKDETGGWICTSGGWIYPPLIMSPDGSHQATILVDGVSVWPTGKSAAGRKLGPVSEELWSVALSPDTRLTAAGTREGSGIRVWDTATGKLVKELPDHGNKTVVVFSPDGRWLTTSKGQSWRVGTWTAAPSLPPGLPAYSPDGRVLALAEPTGAVLLARPGTARVLVRLRDPHGSGAVSLTFTPDGSRLILASNDSRAVHVWDLRQLRRELAALELDWAGPSYGPAPPLRPGPLLLSDAPPARPDGARVTASASAAGSRPEGALDGDRFSAAPGRCWQGKAGERSWWWEVRFGRPRPIGAILQVVGDHPHVFRNAPRDYVWQGSADGRRWHDLAGTAVRGERRMFRLHRLAEAQTLRAVRLKISAADGPAPTLREVELFADPRERVAFPPWAVVVSTTGQDKVPGEGMGFVPLARSCKGYADLQAHNVWLGDFNEPFLAAEPRPLCAFLSGNFIDWCQQKREHWRGTQEVLRRGRLPIWASCGGAQGLAILAEHGLEQPDVCRLQMYS
jgi:WD40 repeat protein